MASLLLQIRDRFDRVGMILSGLCLVHCVAGLVIVAGLGLGGSFLLDPVIHRVGLLLAVLVAGAAIGLGALRHRRRSPLVVAVAGLLFMTGALVVGHGFEEAVLTVIGVTLVAIGHLLNLRAT
jgi:uncharacterized membrane protein YoaK (UPF0700 family)